MSDASMSQVAVECEGACIVQPAVCTSVVSEGSSRRSAPLSVSPPASKSESRQAPCQRTDHPPDWYTRELAVGPVSNTRARARVAGSSGRRGGARSVGSQVPAELPASSGPDLRVASPSLRKQMGQLGCVVSQAPWYSQVLQRGVMAQRLRHSAASGTSACAKFATSCPSLAPVCGCTGAQLLGLGSAVSSRPRLASSVTLARAESSASCASVPTSAIREDSSLRTGACSNPSRLLSASTRPTDSSMRASGTAPARTRPVRWRMKPSSRGTMLMSMEVRLIASSTAASSLNAAWWKE
mmetsp:Transcript_10558/g.26589  ORF Transcript_10558/g.26589 Transcript_10558/m.26589 type:complete len:297 (-) Transcript_10558:1166-2056(-)